MNNQNTTSAGNPGARGSEGQDNSGARGHGNATNQRELPPEGDTDLRDTDARGGGGAASGSSRSQDEAQPGEPGAGKE